MNHFPQLRRDNCRATEDFSAMERATFDRCHTWGYIAVGAGTAIAGVVSKPKAPKAATLKEIDPQEEQRRAVQGNLANQDSIEQLLTRSNRYSQGQANSLMEQAVPGFGRLSGKFTSLAEDKLANRYNVPKEVTDNLSRIAAERGINTGVRGQAGEFSLLRDLGVNMLDYGDRQVNQAQSLLSTVAGLAPRVSPMSPMSFYVSPAQQIAAQTGNNNGIFSTRQAQNNAEAGADNANGAMWGEIVANLSGLYGSGAFGGTSGSNTPDSAAKKRQAALDAGV